MNGEQVIAKILADARDEAGRISGQASEKHAADEAALAQQLKEYEAQTQTLADKARQEKRTRIVSAARMDLARAQLAVKRQLLDEVFSRARDRMGSLKDDDYRQMMTRLMVQSAQQGEQEVVLDRNERRIDTAVVDEANRQLARSGRGPLRLAADRQDVGPGFILRAGRIQNNVSVKVMLMQARDAMEMKLANKLLGS
jgi:V/A-type H+-transporting ATPase subunit E